MTARDDFKADPEAQRRGLEILMALSLAQALDPDRFDTQVLDVLPAAP